jgi:protein-tyrosine phosphatase
MAGKERDQVKRVLFIMIGATALLTLMAGCATKTTTSTPEKETTLVVPVVELPKDVAARVNAAYWAEKHSTPEKEATLVVPVVELPKDVAARVNAAYWAEKHSTPEKETTLVVPVVELPKDVESRK